MIDRYEQAPFDGVGEQALDVMPSPLQLRMVFFFDSVHAGVHFCATRHGAGDFLAEEEVGMAAKFFHRID